MHRKIVHSDGVGSSHVSSQSGARFFVAFVDDSSKCYEVYFLSQTSGVLEALKMYKAHVETQTERNINGLQSDNSREYLNKEFDALPSESREDCLSHGHPNRIGLRSG